MHVLKLRFLKYKENIVFYFWNYVNVGTLSFKDMTAKKMTRGTDFRDLFSSSSISNNAHVIVINSNGQVDTPGLAFRHF